MAVMTALKRIPMSREAYDNLREGPPFFDYVDGEAIEVNRPSAKRQTLLSCVERAVGDHVQVTKLGWVYREISLDLPGGANFGPDLIYVRQGSQDCRMRERGDVVGVPDLIVEVLSPSTEEYDRHEKMARYQRAGVKWVWLIAQDSLLVDEFQWLEDGYAWMLPGSDRTFRPRLFSGLELNLAELIDDSVPSG